jgi:hypothetical protein
MEEIMRTLLVLIVSALIAVVLLSADIPSQLHLG